MKSNKSKGVDVDQGIQNLNMSPSHFNFVTGKNTSHWLRNESKDSKDEIRNGSNSQFKTENTGALETYCKDGACDLYKQIKKGNDKFLQNMKSLNHNLHCAGSLGLNKWLKKEPSANIANSPNLLLKTKSRNKVQLSPKEFQQDMWLKTSSGFLRQTLSKDLQNEMIAESRTKTSLPVSTERMSCNIKDSAEMFPEVGNYKALAVLKNVQKLDKSNWIKKQSIKDVKKTNAQCDFMDVASLESDEENGDSKCTYNNLGSNGNLNLSDNFKEVHQKQSGAKSENSQGFLKLLKEVNEMNWVKKHSSSKLDESRNNSALSIFNTIQDKENFWIKNESNDLTTTTDSKNVILNFDSSNIQPWLQKKLKSEKLKLEMEGEKDQNISDKENIITSLQNLSVNDKMNCEFSKYDWLVQNEKKSNDRFYFDKNGSLNRSIESPKHKMNKSIEKNLHSINEIDENLKKWISS